MSRKDGADGSSRLKRRQETCAAIIAELPEASKAWHEAYGKLFEAAYYGRWRDARVAYLRMLGEAQNPEIRVHTGITWAKVLADGGRFAAAKEELDGFLIDAAASRVELRKYFKECWSLIAEDPRLADSIKEQERVVAALDRAECLRQRAPDISHRLLSGIELDVVRCSDAVRERYAAVYSSVASVVAGRRSRS